MPDTGEGKADNVAAGEDYVLADGFSIPNGVFHMTRILVNPRMRRAWLAREVCPGQLGGRTRELRLPGAAVYRRPEGTQNAEAK
ncbi:hypothetical protein DFH11DRAFT_1730382 [Phellopilus nigrolimitatus]|nr:hypothetical protein DFH11DRAFT_1730382 [Phellopilus nigrolimitatus]